VRGIQIAGATIALLATLSHALAAASARDLYIRGDYAAATQAGEAAATGESLAFAARAAIAEATLRDAPCLSCLKRAEDLARRATLAEPGRAEAYVLLAVSMGLEARIVGVLRAQAARYPERAKDALGKAVALDPQGGATLAAMAAWHLEVVRNGGALGTLLYGARAETGIDLYRRGIAAEPANLVLPYQFALSLSGYALDRYRGEVEMLLAAAIRGMPRTAYERALKARAARLLEVLHAGNARAYAALIAKYQGYP
jgi:hypothetical protein